MEIGIARLAVIIWVAYFGLSGAGLGLKTLPLSLVGNAVYFILAIVLFQYLRSADPLVALALLPLAALGCVVQSIGMIQGDRGIQLVALVFFGLFLATVGYLPAWGRRAATHWIRARRRRPRGVHAAHPARARAGDRAGPGIRRARGGRVRILAAGHGLGAQVRAQ